jgi:hypothetical protein
MSQTHGQKGRLFPQVLLVLTPKLSDTTVTYAGN